MKHIRNVLSLCLVCAAQYLSTILAGVVILFTGVFPVDFPNKENTPLFSRTLLFGARCVSPLPPPKKGIWGISLPGIVEGALQGRFTSDLGVKQAQKGLGTMFHLI